MNGLQKLNGVPLFEVSHLAEFKDFPVRKLEFKKWHKRSRSAYFYRVQKKWEKRFGVKNEPYLLHTADGIYGHPNTIKRLLKAIEDAGTLRETVSTPTKSPDLEKRMDVHSFRGYELPIPVSVRARMDWFTAGA